MRTAQKEIRNFLYRNDPLNRNDKLNYSDALHRNGALHRNDKLHRYDKRIALDQRLHLIVGEREFYAEAVAGGSDAGAVEKRA